MVSRTGLDKISRAAVKTGRIGRVLVSAAVIVWLSVVLVSYYVIHKPFSLENALALANVLGDALVVIALVTVAGALGHRVLRRWEFESPLELGVMSLGVGLGALGLLVFALGLVGIVNTWVYWGLLVISLFLLRNDVRALTHNVRAIFLPRAARSEKFLALFCLLALGITFLLALTPPWSWDGLQYHLIIPKLILEHGRIVLPPDNPSLNYPGLVEMLFLAGMVLAGEGTAQLLHWLYLPLTLGAMLVFAAKYFSWRIGWLAAALFCAVPTIALLATWAYNDLALTFYTFSAFFLTLRARKTNQPRDFILAGILCGLALGEKYTAVFVPVSLALLVVWSNRAALKNATLLLVSAAVVSAPWFIRNYIFVGNPIYPFAFGGLYWDSFRSAWYSRFGSGLLQRPFELLIVPWTMTVQGTQSDLFQGTLGPLILALLPLNLIPARIVQSPRPAPTRAMWYFAAVLYAIWLLGVAESNLLWQSRLLFPAFPLFALLAALGVERLSALDFPQFSLRRFAMFVIALVLALTAASYGIAFATDGALEYFVGHISREEYLVQHLGAHYQIAQWMNANLPRAARVLVLWEPRTYYFDCNVEADAILDRFVHLRYLYKDAPMIASELRRAGFTHVLLYREGLDNILQTGFDPITDQDVATLRKFVNDYLTPVYGATSLGLETRNGRYGLERASQEPYVVYRINAP